MGDNHDTASDPTRGIKHRSVARMPLRPHGHHNHRPAFAPVGLGDRSNQMRLSEHPGSMRHSWGPSVVSGMVRSSAARACL